MRGYGYTYVDKRLCLEMAFVPKKKTAKLLNIAEGSQLEETGSKNAVFVSDKLLEISHLLAKPFSTEKRET